MAQRKKYTPEQIVSLLRQVEVAVAGGKTTAQASKEALISEQTYYRWRKEYGGLQVDRERYANRILCQWIWRVIFDSWDSTRKQIRRIGVVLCRSR
jgi:hypothetical protein